MKLVVLLPLIILLFTFGCTTNDLEKNNSVIINNEVHSDIPQITSITNDSILKNETETKVICIPTQITNNSHPKTNLKIERGNIIWEEKDGYVNKIFVYDITSGKIKELKRSSYESSVDMDVFGNNILLQWRDYFMVYNLISNRYTKVSINYNVDKPSVSDKMITFIAGAVSNKIVGVNITDDPRCSYIIKEGRNDIMEDQDVFGNIVTWISKDVNNVYKIKRYNFSHSSKRHEYRDEWYGCGITRCEYLENEEYIISIHTGREMKNVLSSKNFIVWQERLNDWDIGYYNLSSNKTKLIIQPANQINPSLSMRYIVWQDDRNGKWDIYAYDLMDKKEIQITNDSYNETNPVVSWGKVAWIQDKNIYTCDIQN